MLKVFIGAFLLLLIVNCTEVESTHNEKQMGTKGKIKEEFTEEELNMTEEEYLERQIEEIKKEQEQSNKEFAEKNKNVFPRWEKSSGSKKINSKGEEK